MTQPTFLFVGPDKSGSSWMSYILSLHPDCYVPPAKDIYFFDRYYDKGLDWYLSHFSLAPSSVKAIGELSHDYLFSKEAAKRIKTHLPTVKIVICLRNPIERALSQFQYMRRGGEVGADFHEAAKKFPRIIGNSQYLANLRVYFDIFGADQVEVLIFEDLKTNATTFGKDLLMRLGLNPEIDLPFEKRVREAGMARNRYLSLSLKAGANFSRKLGFSNLVGRIKNSSISKLAYRDFRKNERIILTYAQKRDLWTTYFQFENDELTKIVGRDLSYWAPTE